MLSNNSRRRLLAASLAVFATLSLAGLPARAEQPPDLIHRPYDLNTGLASRSISFENPTGRPAKAARRPATWASAARASR